MLISKKTKENNIAEHIIYMFQVEDMIRANNADLDHIITQIIKPQISDQNLVDQYTKWYADLIQQMKQGKVLERGHVHSIDEVLMELLLLHNTLLNISKNKKYAMAFEKAMPILKDFQHKSNGGDLNLVEIGFNALYGKMILKLKGSEISTATEEGFAAISQMLAVLAHYYKQMKTGNIDFADN